ncbi:MAG TPA: tetratricopeptide repeat protein [Chthonomonadaceae bacterium]|nr:tetratricopeptide repeat protein [Chthonomonadaceae bacterium]
MESTATSPPTGVNKRRPWRLMILAVLGLIAIGVSIGVRQSHWAQERQLKTLSVDELALAIHDSPNDPLTFFYYGSALLRANNPESAEQAFQRSLKLDPKMERAQVGLGTALMREGKLQQANQAFETATKMDPKDVFAYMGIAQTYDSAGSAKRAIDPLKRATELDPKNAAAWYGLGKVYGEAHQPALAVEAINHAVMLAPDKADYWRDLGQLSRHYYKFQDAKQQFEKALALNPDDPVTHFWLGQLYVQMGDSAELRQKAEQELKEAIRLGPTLPDSYFELGRIYERQEEWEKAVEQFRIARKLENSSDDKPIYHEGFCLVKLGKTKEGQELIAGSQALGAIKRQMTDLTTRIIAEPQNRDLHLQLARVYRKIENEDGAKKEYTLYQHLGAHDEAVGKEMQEYDAELRRKAQQQALQNGSR